MNFALSYSGGKDCVLALHRMITAGHTPVALITTVNVDQDRSWFHGIPVALLQAAAGSLKIPLLVCECTADGYAQAYDAGLLKARQIGADACVFGDIDIDGHRQWNQARCEKAGLDCVLPLWNQNREALVHEIIEAGFKAVIKIIQSDKLGESFLGQSLSLSLIAKMKALGIDVCGGNGEYHTFVHDGPIFNHPVPFQMGEMIDFGTHKAINILERTAKA
ncbi:MAG: diphthine--ammonia ligase [Phycisphaerales bacterium]|nr:diphthine--ammonia ligase [Phycisphaerales bacterium]